MAGPYGTPRTWAAGERPTAAQFNAEFRDWITALANPPACRLYHSSTQTMNNGAFTTVAFNTEAYDTDGMHDTVTNNSRITINKAGLYVIQSCLAVPGDADGERITEFLINGSIEAAFERRGANVTTGGDILPLTLVRKFAASDYIECRFYHTAGANLTMAAKTATNETPSFAATWIGIG